MHTSCVMKLRFRTLIHTATTVFLLYFLSACSESEEEVVDVVRPVKLFTVKDSGRENIREFPATVEATEEAEVSFRVAGELVEFPAHPADEVRKGQLLARLDDRDFKNTVAVRQADYDLAAADYRRIASLREKKVVSVADYDQANARLKSSKISLQLAKDQLRDTVLNAPFSGRIAQTMVENYQSVQAQQPILILQSSNTLDVSIQVPETIITKIREEEVNRDYSPTVRFAGNPNKEYSLTYKEHDTRVTPGTQSYTVVFTMQTPEELTIYPGMGGTVTIDLSKVTSRSKALAEYIIPLTAVLKDDSTGKNSAWVYNPETGIVNPVEVTLGPVTDQGITILSGLEAGEEIVSAGLSRLHPGMEVKPLERERGL
ncbi:efflux RND transporter periplasmic adaptor subunit [Endozoicomonas lisbonensis]|uniref:RND family efflux transporter MFP subunit n=1 Tax=Endozoicomonas lisbonensis TaxID=3120522 RepID=A0ABV2SEA5_9GAMM